MVHKRRFERQDRVPGKAAGADSPKWSPRKLLSLIHIYGRSDNGGESEARAAMILARVATPELQVEITRPGNAGYYLADYGWQMPNGSWMLAELHGLGKFEDESQNDPEHIAAKTYRAALMRDANLRAMGHNLSLIHILKKKPARPFLPGYSSK